MDPLSLLQECYAANACVAQAAQGEFAGLNSGLFSSGICDCDGGDCCSPGRLPKEKE
jgi:hypothetical protein